MSWTIFIVVIAVVGVLTDAVFVLMDSWLPKDRNLKNSLKLMMITCGVLLLVSLFFVFRISVSFPRVR
jgi:hypothetical protein